MVCKREKNQDKLILEEIRNKRELMMECANKNGLNCEETIRYSQKLDEVINKYQRVCIHTSIPLKESRLSFKQMIIG